MSRLKQPKGESAIPNPKSAIRWGGLRNKIASWFFVPTAIILIAVALVTYLAYQQVTETLVFERDQDLTRLSAGQLAVELTDYTDLLATVARARHGQMSDPLALRAALEQDRNRLVVFDGGLVVLDTFGTVVAAEPDRPKILGQDWSNRAYFRGMAFSDIVTDGPEGAEVIVIAVPITGDQGEFLGTMAGMFRLGATAVSAFYGEIVKLRLEGSGNTYLVDGHGRVIYHSDSSRIGEDFADQMVVRQVLQSQTGAIRTQDFVGRDIVAGFAPVPGTSWGLIKEETWATLTSGSQNYQRSLLLLLVLGVVIPTVIVVIGLKRIMQPIEALIDAAQEVAKGNFGQTIKARSGDEIEALATQFNLMSAHLKESYGMLEQRVADRTRELAILNAIGAIVNESLDLYTTLDHILDEAMGLLNMEAGQIRLVDEETDELVIRTERGLSLEYVHAAHRLKVTALLPDTNGTSDEPIIIEDLATAPDYELARQEGLQTIAIFPLRAKESLLGTLSLGTRTGPRPFSRSERELLRAVSDQAAVAIENAQLYVETSRRVDEVETLLAVQQAITSRLDLDSIMKLIADEARRLTSSKTSISFLLEGDELVISVVSGEAIDNAFVGYRMPVENSLTGLTFKSGKPIRVADAGQDPRAHADLVQRLGIQSLMVVPLRSGSEPIGSISVTNKILGTFTGDDERVLTMLASGAAIAIENARLYGQAQQAAMLEERQRLARDLHDSVTQSLYGVTMYAEAAARLLSAGQTEIATDHLRELRGTAQEALQEMRLLLFELRPPVLEEEGLVAALQTRLEAVERRSGLEIALNIVGDEDQLPLYIEEALYRIALEALNNTLKHAQAHKVEVLLHHGPECVKLAVIDDGLGFDPANLRKKGGMGLSNMQERARLAGGQLTVDSQPGEGTKVLVEIAAETYQEVKHV